MATRTITIHDCCTSCNRTLYSISEGERGLCSSCWVKTLSPEKKSALNKLIASAFNGPTEEQKSIAVDEALKQMRVSTCPKCGTEMIHSRLKGYQCQRCS